MTEEKVSLLKQALEKFLKEIEKIRSEHDQEIEGILKEIDEKKIKDLKKDLGI